MDAQKPTVGRIVHYFNRGLESFWPNGIGPYPAIVTFVPDGTSCDLDVLPARTVGHVNGVPFGSDENRVEWWEWPPRA